MPTPPAPGVDPALPPRSRGVIALLEENCTVCMICARECPVWCIHIDSHTETEPTTDGQGRDRTYNLLDVFDIDYGVCMYCGICVEVCPFDALHWSPELAEPETDPGGLVHDRDRLRGWLPVVPPPPALDPRAEEPKEVETSRRAVGRPGER